MYMGLWRRDGNSGIGSHLGDSCIDSHLGGDGGLNGDGFRGFKVNFLDRSRSRGGLGSGLESDAESGSLLLLLIARGRRGGRGL